MNKEECATRLQAQIGASPQQIEDFELFVERKAIKELRKEGNSSPSKEALDKRISILRDKYAVKIRLGESGAILVDDN